MKTFSRSFLAMCLRRMAVSLMMCIAASAAMHAQGLTRSYVERADSADAYIKMERWADAERNLKMALRLEPGNPGNALLLSNLGYVQTKLGLIDQALESYAVSLSIAPRSAVVLSNRALTYIEAGRKEEAMADLNASLAIDSTRAMPLRWRGFLRLSDGDFSGARHDFNALKTVEPNNPAAFDGLAQCMIHDANPAEAITLTEKALQLEKSPDRFFLKALLEMENGRLPEAAETLRTAIRDYPREGDLYLLRARLHELNYRPEDAAIDKKTARENGADSQLFQQLFGEK